MSNYNGWTNWETWNAYNWLTSDENTVREMEGLAERMDRNRAAEVIEERLALPLEEWPSGFYKDVVTASLDLIDYRELARAFEDE